MDRTLSSATTYGCCYGVGTPPGSASLVSLNSLVNRDEIEQQLSTDHSSQPFNWNLETQQPFEPFVGFLNGAQASAPGVENGDQAATPRQLDAGRSHQPDHEIPLPVPQASLPAVPVESTGDNNDIR